MTSLVLPPSLVMRILSSHLQIVPFSSVLRIHLSQPHHHYFNLWSKTRNCKLLHQRQHVSRSISKLDSHAIPRHFFAAYVWAFLCRGKKRVATCARTTTCLRVSGVAAEQERPACFEKNTQQRCTCSVQEVRTRRTMLNLHEGLPRTGNACYEDGSSGCSVSCFEHRARCLPFPKEERNPRRSPFFSPPAVSAAADRCNQLILASKPGYLILAQQPQLQQWVFLCSAWSKSSVSLFSGFLYSPVEIKAA